jgi:hypothetical protein
MKYERFPLLLSIVHTTSFHLTPRYRVVWPLKIRSPVKQFGSSINYYSSTENVFTYTLSSIISKYEITNT